jgi:hypothetical protein
MSWSFTACGTAEQVKQQAALQFCQTYYGTMKQPEQATVRAVQLIIESTCDGARPGAIVNVSAYGSQNWNMGEPWANNNVNLSINVS